jgi:hypothetical protein
LIKSLGKDSGRGNYFLPPIEAKFTKNLVGGNKFQKVSVPIEQCEMTIRLIVEQLGKAIKSVATSSIRTDEIYIFVGSDETKYLRYLPKGKL